MTPPPTRSAWGNPPRRLTFLGTGDPLNGERAHTSLAFDLADGATLLLDTTLGGRPDPLQRRDRRIPNAILRQKAVRGVTHGGVDIGGEHRRSPFLYTSTSARLRYANVATIDAG